MNSFKIAVNTFDLQYDALPGGMIDAEDYRGSSAVNNGNGNGLIGDISTERTRAWDMLVLAELLLLQYDNFLSEVFPDTNYTFVYADLYGRTSNAIQ